MKFQASAKLILSFTLSRQQINMLLELSQMHYDHLCGSVGRPGHGSFLWGWNVSCFDLEEAQVSADLRELNITMKILEGAPPDLAHEAASLSRLIRSAIVNGEKAASNWSAEFDVS